MTFEFVEWRRPMEGRSNRWVVHFCDPGSGTIGFFGVGTWRTRGSRRG